MQFHFSRHLATVAVAASFMLSTAHAALVHNTTGLSVSHSTETFDQNTGAASAAGTQFNGITFSQGLYVSNDFVLTNFSGSSIANFYPCCTALTSLNFDTVQTAVAFAFISNPSNTVFSAYLGNVLVETATELTDASGDFYGFSGITFDSIRIENTASGYVLDNLQRAVSDPNPVPEPTGLALLAAGAMGLLATRRRAVPRLRRAA